MLRGEAIALLIFNGVNQEKIEELLVKEIPTEAGVPIKKIAEIIFEFFIEKLSGGLRK